MYKNIILFFALCLGTVLSKTVSFKVISFGEKVKVKVNGKKYTLKRYNDIMFYGKITNLPDGDLKYQYIVDGVKENFERTLDKKENSTHNEFYGRKITVSEPPKFSYPGAKWNKSIGRTELFDQSYIPTIHIIGKEADTLMKKPKNKYYYMEKVNFYLKDAIHTFKNVRINPKNWGFAKFQMRMELINDNIYGRTLLKLRNGGEDPLNLRQLIYGNIIEALGIPSIKSVMVRVYYNKKPAGFYTLQEEAFSESFVKAEFHGNPTTEKIKNEKIGEPFNGEAGAEFDYCEDLNYYGQFKSNKKNPNKTKLRALAKAIKNLNTKKEKELKKFEKQWFDIDSFHKAMAMEYLTADWDGYWYSNANFALYDVPQESTKNTFKHYFITQDHDETCGVGLVAPHNVNGYDHPKLSYKTLIRKQWEVGSPHRILVDKFINSTPALQKRFENTLVSIVQNIFNPVEMKKVIGYFHDRYMEEMEWDFSFERVYKPSKAASKDMPVYDFKNYETALTKQAGGLVWGLYTWVDLRAAAISKEFCVKVNGVKFDSKCKRDY
ncbi:hypothetical protein PIROE2DRAFT_18145 [Piromyces sp. E2]|nr:hypothetical protein PIROE2DRAFT_18145 [Piromyces sp. E2]|eukprot:OUM57008.1 hypothetical protein PIROE2DRAFT_18145 [Piromyces sp. E2]